MEFSGWDASFSVGHPLMDEHHQKLFALIADLEAAITSNDVLQEYFAELEAAGQLSDYTATHFAEEEALMAAAGYPDLAQHRELHQLFMSRIAQLESDLMDDSKAPQLEDLCQFLNQWLASHILGVDQKYSSYLNKLPNR